MIKNYQIWSCLSVFMTRNLAFMLAKIIKNIKNAKARFEAYCVCLLGQKCSVALFHHQFESYAVYVLDVDVRVVLEIFAELGDVNIHRTGVEVVLLFPDLL